MKNKLLVSCMFAILLFLGASNDSHADKEIKLHLGQTISADGLKFTFQEIKDSRCPSDVTCVWEGQVTATVKIQDQTHTKTVDFMPSDPYTFFSPYKIILVDVSPYPISTVAPDDHVATLVVSSTDGANPCEEDRILKDGLCVTKPPGPLDFRETDTGLNMLYTYGSFSLVGIVIGFFAIKKWINKK